MLEWSNSHASKALGPQGHGGSPRIRGAPGVCRANHRILRAVYYVYVLQSGRDTNLYIGYTHDLRRRITEHTAGKVVSTKHRRPLKLLCYEAYMHKAEAQRREDYLKSSDGKKDLQKRLTVSLQPQQYKQSGQVA